MAKIFKKILCDIDHTISNAAWRDHMIGVSSWDEYHAEAEKDQVIEATVTLVRALYRCGHDVIGLTSRPIKFRDLSIKWLVKHDVPIEKLIMRDENDFRPSPELKLDLAKKEFGNDLNRSVLLLIEDRDDVVAAFRAEGVACVHVRGGATG